MALPQLQLAAEYAAMIALITDFSGWIQELPFELHRLRDHTEMGFNSSAWYTSRLLQTTSATMITATSDLFND